jgi:hypothetical protein
MPHNGPCIIISEPFAAIAKKMPDGRVRPVISMFPDMPYYGFLLIGASEPVINSGFSKDGTTHLINHSPAVSLA